MAKSPTNALTQEALKVLKINGFDVWRQNNTAIRGRSFTGRLGLSDILGFYRYGGQIVAVEVKTGKDTLSPEQIEYLADVDRAGGFAYECRDIQGLVRAIIEWKSKL